MGGLIIASLTIGMLLHWSVAIVLSAYLLNNVAYTLHLKHLAYIDIACIALGFLLRVLAGGMAIAVQASSWLLVCTFLLASLLALGKRRHELVVVLHQGECQGTRAVLRKYKLHHIDWAMRLLAAVTVVSYALYTLSPNTIAQFNTDQLVYSIPFVLAGLWRFNAIVRKDDNAQSPTDSMVRDLPFILNVLLWGIFVTVTIYLGT
jgi:4-hydroxybenzoate polyprenyltransferase